MEICVCFFLVLICDAWHWGDWQFMIDRTNLHRDLCMKTVAHDLSYIELLNLIVGVPIMIFKFSSVDIYFDRKIK